MANGILPNEQENAEIRRRQIAVLKASNQMLKEAEEKALSKTNDKVRQSELKRQFDRAIEENTLKARNFLHADINEMESVEYRDVDQIYIDKYNRRLEKKGLTDEELHRKESATFSTSKDEKGKNRQLNRRPRKGAKKDLGEDYVPLDNEEELMNLTMVKDDKQIEKQIEKNEKVRQELEREKNDKWAKMTSQIKDASVKQKVQSVNNDNMERVVVETKKDDILVKNNTQSQNEEIKVAEVIEKKTKKKNYEPIKYDFDFGNIPNYVQYDVIPLPSNGQCYPTTSPLRCGRVPVAYLTAADENIINSPNAYRDGKLFDIILGRKILDKRINPRELCSGDRDAIILWLRATAYGEDFPVVTTNPETRKQYNITVNLSQFDYKDFDLESDEDGLFDFETDNGDIIKFKFLTADDEETFRRKIREQIIDSNKIEILKNISSLSILMDKYDINEDDRKLIDEDIEEIKEIIGEDTPDVDNDVYPDVITEQMFAHTVCINGNYDTDYIKGYIENMRTKTAKNYRDCFEKNKPGVDFKFTVNIPESDGGGSFSTFLRLTDTIFINA